MNERYEQLANFSKVLLSTACLEDGLRLISKYTKKMIAAERTSIFIHDAKHGRLWTVLADEKEKIVIPYDVGLVGQTMRTQKGVLENEPYNNANFLADVDMETGYYTQSILTAPIFNSKRRIIGVLELLNKKGGFSNDDKIFIDFFAHYISGYIELTQLYTPKNAT